MNKKIVIPIIIVLLAAIGFGGYYYLTEVKPSNDFKAKYGSLPNFDTLMSQLDQEKASISKNPNNDTLYVDLGNVYYNFGDYADALISYQKAADLNPGNYLPYYWMARVAVQKEDYQSAQSFYLKAISADPKAEFPYVDLARLYTWDMPKERDSGAIMKLMEQGLKVNPGNETLLRTLLAEYGRQNNEKGQIDAIKRILAVSPNDSMLKAELSRLEGKK